MTLHEVSTRDAPARRTPPAVGESINAKFGHRHAGNHGRGQLPHCVRAVDDVGERDATAPRRSPWCRRGVHDHVGLRFERRQVGRGVEAQVSESRQGRQHNVPIRCVRPQTRRMGRRGNRRVVGRGAQRVMRKCGARGRRRVWRVGSRPLGLPVRVAVVVFLVIVGVASGHAVPSKTGEVATAPRCLQAVRVILPLVLLIMMMGRGKRFPLDLMGGTREHAAVVEVVVVGRSRVTGVEAGAV
jgi:hypothetical protein